MSAEYKYPIKAQGTQVPAIANAKWRHLARKGDALILAIVNAKNRNE